MWRGLGRVEGRVEGGGKGVPRDWSVCWTAMMAMAGARCAVFGAFRFFSEDSSLKRCRLWTGMRGTWHCHAT